MLNYPPHRFRLTFQRTHVATSASCTLWGTALWLSGAASLAAPSQKVKPAVKAKSPLKTKPATKTKSATQGQAKSPVNPALKTPLLVVQRRHQKYILSVARGPKDVLVSSDGSRVCVWRALGDDLLWAKDFPVSSGISEVGVVGNSTILLGSWQSVTALDLWTGQEVASLSFPKPLQWRFGANSMSAVSEDSLEVVRFDAVTRKLSRALVALPAVVRQAFEQPEGQIISGIPNGSRTGSLMAPGGKQAIVFGGTLALAIDAKSGQVRKTFDASPAQIRRVALSPDGTRVVFSTSGGFKSFNVQSGTKEWEAAFDYVPPVAFSPDGTRLFADALRDSRTGAKLTQEQEAKYRGAWTWTADGTQIVIGDESRIHLVKNEIGPAPERPAIQLTDPKGTFDPTESDEAFTARVANDKVQAEERNKEWEANGRFPALVSSPVGNTPKASPSSLIAFSPTGDRVALASGEYTGAISLWSWPALEPLTTKNPVGPNGQTYQISDLKWSRDGSRFVAGGERSFEVFDGKDGSQLLVKTVPSNGNEFGFAPDGKSVFYLNGFERRLEALSLDGTPVALVTNARKLGFDERGTTYGFVARSTPGAGNSRLQWLIKTSGESAAGRPKGANEVVLEGEGISPLVFSGDAALALSLKLQEGQRAVLQSHDAKTGRIVASIPLTKELYPLGDGTPTLPLRFAERSHLFSVISPGSVSVWNGDDLKQLASFPVVNAKSAAISPDGKCLVVAAGDAFQVWNLSTKKRIGQLYMAGTTAQPFEDSSQPFGVNWIKIAADGSVAFSPLAAATLRWRKGNGLQPVLPEEAPRQNITFKIEPLFSP